MYAELIAVVASFVLGLVVGKPLWKRFIRSAKEFADVLNVVLHAVEDGKITQEEVKDIKCEIKEFLWSLKEIK